MSNQDLYNTIKETLSCDSPYPADALLFYANSITQALHQLQIANAHEPPDLGAQEIVEAFASDLVEKYWFMSLDILESWNIHASNDLASMMNILIKARLFSHSKNDQQEDFANTIDVVNLVKQKLPLNQTPLARPDIIIE